MPAGIFQPVSAAPAAQRHDLSLWRCMTREFSEELLGGSEEYPTRAGRLDYGRWPFHRELAAARDAGTLRVSCLGLGVDPLTLATDILTVAVFEAAVFDRVFRGLVARERGGPGGHPGRLGRDPVHPGQRGPLHRRGRAAPDRRRGPAPARLAAPGSSWASDGPAGRPRSELPGASPGACGPEWVQEESKDGRGRTVMATKPVIAGADGSQESLRAVEWAAREAVLRAPRCASWRSRRCRRG